MIGALLLGAAAQSSLVLSGLIVYVVKVPTRVVGALAGFGAGALIAAVAFDLIPEPVDLENAELALWLLGGALIFVVSDRIVEAHFGGEDSSGSPLGIVVGSGSRRCAGVPDLRHPVGCRRYVERLVHRCGLDIEHPAGARAVGCIG